LADQLPDDTPTWIAVAISVATTVAGLKAWGPLGRWLGRRFDQVQQARLSERADTIARLTAEIAAKNEEAKARVEENVQLRQELGEERELRVSFATDYAVLKRDVEHLTRTMAEDKRDCQREIRRLNGDIKRLQGEVTEMRSQQREPMP
jgi:chromosome segregation ATPase